MESPKTPCENRCGVPAGFGNHAFLAFSYNASSCICIMKLPPGCNARYPKRSGASDGQDTKRKGLSLITREIKGDRYLECEAVDH